MRTKFYDYLTLAFKADPKMVIVLGDIGVHSLRECFEHDPKRIINIGICEQAMIGVCSGLADQGFHVVVHSIAPFVTERCYEQLKLLAYEKKSVVIVSVGGSYNYAKLGITHHCPGDIAIMGKIPNMRVMTPVTADSAINFMEANFKIGDLDTGVDDRVGSSPMYIRLEEQESNSVAPKVLNPDSRNGIVFILGRSVKDINKLKNINANIFVCETVSPSYGFYVNFPGTMHETKFRDYKPRVTVVEKCYQTDFLLRCIDEIGSVSGFHRIGMNYQFIDKYGSQEEIDKYLGLDDDSIYEKLKTIYGELPTNGS